MDAVDYNTRRKHSSTTFTSGTLDSVNSAPCSSQLLSQTPRPYGNLSTKAAGPATPIISRACFATCRIFVVSGDADRPQAQKFPPLSQFLGLRFATVVDVGEAVRQESTMMGSQTQANYPMAQAIVPLPLFEEGLQCTCSLPQTPNSTNSLTPSTPHRLIA